MRRRHILASIGAVALVPGALAAPARNSSWGKPGVSLDQYAADATDCVAKSRSVAVALKPETVRMLDGLSAAQLLYTVEQIGGTIDAMAMVDGIGHFHSENDIARRTNTFGAKYVAVARVDVADELQAALDRCLIDRGYSRLALTDDQMRSLAKLKRHSAARTAYLHAIDSNPDLIAQQALPTDRDRH